MKTHVKQELLQTAFGARDKAYAPYSDFTVGAAVLAENESIIAGANVENSSYGLTICAERVAAAAAVAAGHRQLLAVAVASSGGVPLCGACLQFLAEFGPDMDVLLINADKPDCVSETTLGTLLPEQFRLEKN